MVEDEKMKLKIVLLSMPIVLLPIKVAKLKIDAIVAVI